MQVMQHRTAELLTSLLRLVVVASAAAASSLCV
jgi:hypothetical protein